MNPVDLRLYAIIGPEQAGGRALPDLVRAAIRGGCTLVQYRDKASPTRAMVEQARALRGVCAGAGVPLLVNDRADVAFAAGADGVHLGQEDLSVADARRLLGPKAIIGLTVKTAPQADELYRLRADYACIGGVFATTSKVNPAPPVGLDGLSRIAFRVRLAAPGTPVGAIAGITAANAAATIGAGADGVAVISALFGADDVEAAARALRGTVDRALQARGALAR